MCSSLSSQIAEVTQSAWVSLSGVFQRFFDHERDFQDAVVSESDLQMVFKMADRCMETIKMSAQIWK